MRIFLISLLLIPFTSFAYTPAGNWYEGIPGLSFPTVDDACDAAVTTIAFEQDKEGVLTSIERDNSTTWKCHYTLDGARKTRQVVQNLKGHGFDSNGANSKRFLVEQDDLIYPQTPEDWFFSTSVRGPNPFHVCKSLAARSDTKEQNFTHKFSHLEIFNNSGMLTPSHFNCISTKQRIDGAPVVGYFNSGKISHSAWIEGSPSITYPLECTSEICGGDPIIKDPSQKLDEDLSELIGLMEEQIAVSEAIKVDTSSIAVDTTQIDRKFAQVLSDTRNIDSTLTEINDTSKNSSETLDIIANALNTDIIIALEDLGVNSDVQPVVTAIQNSNTSISSKLDGISSILSNTSNGQINTSDLVAAIQSNNLNSQMNSLENSINRNTTNQASAILASTNDIVNAIYDTQSSGNGSGTEPDTTAIEELNESIKGLDSSINSPSDLSFDINPNLESESFWESSYPDGLIGVWNEKSVEFKNTSLANWLDSFSANFNGQANYPIWNFCFDLGFIDFGCNDLKVDDRIWAAIRVFLMLTAFFYSRRLVFGG